MVFVKNLKFFCMFLVLANSASKMCLTIFYKVKKRLKTIKAEI